MEIEYRRNNGKHYMILTGGEKLYSYEEKMLAENRVSVLLQFYTIKANQQMQYWYDITGKQSVKDYGEKGELSLVSISDIVKAIYDCSCLLGEYLIPEERIYLSPSTFFIGKKDGVPEGSVCFFPQENETIHEQLLGMTEFFLMKVDHDDEQALQLCYALYEEAMKETSSPETLYGITKDFVGRQDPMQTAVDLLEYEITDDQDDTSALQTEEAKDEEQRVSLSEVFDDDDDDEPTIVDRLEDFITGIPGRIMTRIKGKKEEIFPPKDLEEDFIYDPSEDFEVADVSSTPDVSNVPDVSSAAEVSGFSEVSSASDVSNVMNDSDGNIEKNEDVEKKENSFSMLRYDADFGEGDDYMLGQDEVNVGSSVRDNDLVVKSAIVSRHHAKIHYIKGKYYLEDLNSTNGTYINGHMIIRYKKYELRHMDRIYFANIPYRVLVG